MEILTSLEPPVFDALIVMDTPFTTDWFGVPEITPVEEFRVKPEGREPEITLNVQESPVIVVFCVTKVPFANTNED